MIFLWLGIFFLSMSWLFLLPIFVQPMKLGIILIVLGIISHICWIRKNEIKPLDKKYLWLLLPLSGMALILPSPYDSAFIILCIGLLISGVFSLISKPSFWGIGITCSGSVLLFQTLLLPVFYVFASRFHEFSFLNPFYNFFINAFGYQSSLVGSLSKISTFEKVYSLSTSWEKLGLYPSLNFLIGTVPILFLLRCNAQKFLKFFLLIAGYSLVRLFILIILFLEFKNQSIFWNPIFVTLSYFPILFIFNRFFSLPYRNIMNGLWHLGKYHLSKSNFTIGLLTLFAIIMLTGFWGFHDPGTLKKGRILLDEAHSNWEWTDKEYDTDWYGRTSGYNYYCFSKYISYFYQLDKNDQEISQNLLKDYDILIIKTATSPFKKKEVNAIVNFVKSGGGLFVIGDHTNVFGMSTYMNPIVENFGITFNYDSQYDLQTGKLSLYYPPKILPHPIVQNTPVFLFATSATLNASLLSEEVMVGYGLKTMQADYSQENFFPEKSSFMDNDISFGLFIQAAAKKFGKGRVFLFTDSTCFSNFFMFMPGKPELLLGSLNWLNRENKFHLLNRIFFCFFYCFHQ